MKPEALRWRAPVLLVLRGAQLVMCTASLTLTFGAGPSGFSTAGQVIQFCVSLLTFVAALTVDRPKRPNP